MEGVSQTRVILDKNSQATDVKLYFIGTDTSSSDL